MQAKLTGKQQAFCYEYTVDHNAKEAAIRAGYSEHTAKEAGCRLLTNVNCKTEIDRIEAEKHAEIGHNYEIAVQELRKRLAYIQKIAEKGNIQAVQVQLAILRELDDITGLHKQTIHNINEPTQPIDEAEEQALADLARTYKAKLAKGLRGVKNG